jgi:hypothetical protein
MIAREAPIHRMEDLADYMRQRMNGALRHVGEAHRAGIIIALGTDSGAGTFDFPGFSAHVAMELLADILTTPTLAITMAYTAEEFQGFLRTGVALGGRELEMMSGLARGRYASFTDDEIDALHDYLRTLAETPPRP